MTKMIRIENADTSSHPVRVTIENKDHNTGEWKAEQSLQLDHPTFMANQVIHSHRRLVIEELAGDPKPSA